MFNAISIVLLGIIGGPELIIIAIIVLVLFGGRKIPELMHGLGSGVKDFKEASKDTTNTFKETTNTFKKERDEIMDRVNQPNGEK